MMFNYNNNVFMQAYGDGDAGGGAGGGTGGGDPSFNLHPTGGGRTTDFELVL